MREVAHVYILVQDNSIINLRTGALTMARKSSAKKKSSGSKKDYSDDDVVRLEKESLAKANKAISSIENALATWNAAKIKPDALAPRVNKLRYFHDALSRWEKKMLKAMSTTPDVQTRIGRLREFSDICHLYSQG